MWMHRTVLMTAFAMVAMAWSAAPVCACPFCGPPGPTLVQEIDGAAVAVIAHYRRAGSEDLSNPEATKAEFAIDRVIKGGELLGDRRSIRAHYYTPPPADAKLLFLANNPPDLVWAPPVTLTPRGWNYLNTMLELPRKGPERLLIALAHLEDQEKTLRTDAYDEFAWAPFEEVRKLGPQLQPDDLVKRIADPAIQSQNVRLYCTLLGVCGKPQHAAALEVMLRSGKQQFTPSIDAMVAAYLRLKGVEGLPVIEQLFLTSESPDDATKANATINALRFHGQEPDVIPRERIVELMRKLLDRPQLAARVLLDLARWNQKPEDWRDIDRVAALFVNAKGDTLWVREPAVGYLVECPLPEAKAQLEKLAKIDPAAVKRGMNPGLPQDSTVYLGSAPATPKKKQKPAAVSAVSASTPVEPRNETAVATATSQGSSLLWNIAAPVAGGALAVCILAWVTMRRRSGSV